jgi:cytochrome P450
MQSSAMQEAFVPGLTGADSPPLAAGLPGIGNFAELVRDPLPFMIEQARRLGPIYRIKAFHRRWVCMAGPEANAFFSRHGEEYFAQDEGYRGFNEAFNSKSFLVSLDGPRHVHLRKVQQRAMGRGALEARLPELLAIADDELDAIRPGDVLDVITQLKHLAVRQLGLVLTGRDGRGLMEDVQFLLNVVINASHHHTWPRFMMKIPPFTTARARVFGDTMRLIAQHRSKPKPFGEGDLVDDMLASTMADGSPIPEETVGAAVMGSYMAGLDTSAITAAFALYALLSDRALYERVLADVDRCFEAGATVEDFRGMHDLRGAVLEANRRYPVATALARDCKKDFEFGGYQVRRGDNLLLPMVATHFDARFFPEPMRFDIDRFREPRAEHKRGQVFAPFGLGSHRCLGAGMGELQTMLMVAVLLRKFELDVHPTDYRLKIVTAPLRRPCSRYRLRVVARRG